MMAVSLPVSDPQAPFPMVEVPLSSYSALAESAWMGSVQATEVLDTVQISKPAARKGFTLPKLELAGLFTRELNVAEASLVLMVSFFLSALLGAVRQILFNSQFGTSVAANAYYAAFRLPDTLFSLVAGGALSSAMIPVLLDTINQKGPQAGQKLISLVFTTLLAAFALIVLLGEIFTPFFVHTILAPGFDSATSQLTVQLTRIMLLQPLILAVGSVATAVLNSRNRFFSTALSIAGHNIALIAGLLASRIVPALGIYGPTLGVVGGGVLQALILLPGLLGQGTSFRFLWDIHDPDLRHVIRLLIPNGLSVGVNYSGFIVDTAFATQASNPAGLPALYNAWLLVGLPIALLGQAIGQAVFPRLAAHASSQQWMLMRSSLLRSIGAAIVIALPALAALLLIGRPAIRILFEHGQYGAQAGDLTYSLLVIYSLALPAYITTELVTRGLIALQDTRTPLMTNTLQLLARGVILFLFVKTLGVITIPVAFALSATVETMYLTSVLLIRVNKRIQAGGKHEEPSFAKI